MLQNACIRGGGQLFYTVPVSYGDDAHCTYLGRMCRIHFCRRFENLEFTNLNLPSGEFPSMDGIDKKVWTQWVIYAWVVLFLPTALLVILGKHSSTSCLFK